MYWRMYSRWYLSRSNVPLAARFFNDFDVDTAVPGTATAGAGLDRAGNPTILRDGFDEGSLGKTADLAGRDDKDGHIRSQWRLPHILQRGASMGVKTKQC